MAEISIKSTIQICDISILHRPSLKRIAEGVTQILGQAIQSSYISLQIKGEKPNTPQAFTTVT